MLLNPHCIVVCRNVAEQAASIHVPSVHSYTYEENVASFICSHVLHTHFRITICFYAGTDFSKCFGEKNFAETSSACMEQLGVFWWPQSWLFYKVFDCIVWKMWRFVWEETCSEASSIKQPQKGAVLDPRPEKTATQPWQHLWQWRCNSIDLDEIGKMRPKRTAQRRQNDATSLWNRAKVQPNQLTYQSSLCQSEQYFLIMSAYFISFQIWQCNKFSPD